MTIEQNTASWSVSYTRFLTESAEISTRSLKLYQEAIEEVSNGRLPPTVFQDSFSQFAQSHAPQLTAQLAEVGARFMTDLLRVGDGFSQRAGGNGGETELPPPHFDPQNPARWYEHLADYAGQLNARAVRAYRAQLDRVASGEVTPSEVQQNATDQMARRMPEYLQRLSQIYFDLLNGLNETRAKYEETYFRGVLAQAARGASDAAIVVRLFGVRGTTVSTSLALANTTEKPAPISYRVSELRRADGIGPAFTPKLNIYPEQLEIDPGVESTINLTLSLDPETYEGGVPYVGAIHISGGPDLQVKLDLRVVATESSPGGIAHGSQS